MSLLLRSGLNSLVSHEDVAMASVPSVKGILFKRTISFVQDLEKEGIVTRPQLERCLSPEALRYLDEAIVPVLWYPISIYRELSQLRWELAPDRGSEAQIESGRRAAETLAASGPYKSMNATIAEWGQRIVEEQSRLLSTMYNFLNVTVRSDSSSYSIEVIGAAPLPDSWRFASQGFIDYLARRHWPDRIQVTSERPLADKVVFHIRIR